MLILNKCFIRKNILIAIIILRNIFTAPYLKKYALQTYCIKQAIENFNSVKDNNNLFLEFGVFSGTSINLFSNELKGLEIFGFDSLKELMKIGMALLKKKVLFQCMENFRK